MRTPPLYKPFLHVSFSFAATLGDAVCPPYQAVTGGMGWPFLLHVTKGEGLPWTSQGRTTSVPTSADIWTTLSCRLAPCILGKAVE